MSCLSLLVVLLVGMRPEPPPEENS